MPDPNRVQGITAASEERASALVLDAEPRSLRLPEGPGDVRVVFIPAGVSGGIGSAEGDPSSALDAEGELIDETISVAGNTDQLIALFEIYDGLAATAGSEAVPLLPITVENRKPVNVIAVANDKAHDPSWRRMVIERDTAIAAIEAAFHKIVVPHAPPPFVELSMTAPLARVYTPVKDCRSAMRPGNPHLAPVTERADKITCRPLSRFRIVLCDPADQLDGSITLSMTWMTPLSARISAATTLAPSTVTAPPDLVTDRVRSPALFSVFT